MPDKNKNAEKLLSFIAYCLEHPEQRFWQALRNWSGYSYVIGRFGDDLIQDNVVKEEDTFYLE